jgi:hypothetical protein
MLWPNSVKCKARVEPIPPAPPVIRIFKSILPNYPNRALD